GLDACLFDRLSGGVQVGPEAFGPVLGVQAGGEDVRGIGLEVKVEVDIAAVVGAGAAHLRSGLVRVDLVPVVVDDQRLARPGVRDRPAGGVDASVVEAAQQDQV